MWVKIVLAPVWHVGLAFRHLFSSIYSVLRLVMAKSFIQVPLIGSKALLLIIYLKCLIGTKCILEMSATAYPFLVSWNPPPRMGL